MVTISMRPSTKASTLPPAASDFRGETCPICGRRTRKTPDVLDELVEAVIDAGATIHHVRAETELNDRLVASSLRFALPPMPEPAQAGTA